MLGVVKGFKPEALQPAGIDLSVDEVEVLDEAGVIGVSERYVPRGVKVEDKGGWWALKPGVYRIRFREIVSVPAGFVGFCFPRSSLLRMGLLLSCGVWDPGYRGRGQALLAVLNGKGVSLERGARVAQFVLARLWGPQSSEYRGVYMGEGL